MKKAISVFLIFTLIISMLSGCGGKTEEAPTSSVPTQSSQSSSAAQPASASEGPKTIVVESADYGDITLAIPSDITSEIAGPGVESLDVLTVDYYGDLSVSTEDMVMYQKVHIQSDGVNMVVGYTDFSDESFKTFDNAKYNQRDQTLQEINHGGEDGYCYVYGTLVLAFPATTQHASRRVAIYPDEMPEDNTGSDLDEWLYLLELPWVAEILDSLSFTGETKEEDKWETQPFEVHHYALTPVDGWEVQSLSGQVCTLKKEGVSDWFTSNEGSAEIFIWPWEIDTAAEELEERLESQVTNYEQKENITINGREYFQLQADENSSITGYVLITSMGETFDPDADGYIRIEVRYTFDLDEAMPQLENITIK